METGEGDGSSCLIIVNFIIIVVRNLANKFEEAELSGPDVGVPPKSPSNSKIRTRDGHVMS